MEGFEIPQFRIQVSGWPKAIGVQDILTKSGKAATAVVTDLWEEAIIVRTQHSDDL